MQENLKKWILSMRDNDGFKFSEESPSSLLSTCFGILALNQINYSFSDEERKKYTDKILSFKQDNGLFIDRSLLKNFDLIYNSHNYAYVVPQMTDFSIYALYILNYDKYFKLDFLEGFNRNKITNWLNRLNWGNPWCVSNNTMFLLDFLIYQKEALSDKKAEELIDAMFEWFDKHQDPKTGFWGMDRCKDNLSGMAGAFHIIIFYYYLNRKLNYEREMVDTTLSLQRKDGLFGRDIGGGACEDLDAVDILVKITRNNDYKKEEIKKALEKVHDNLLNINRNEDGGFCQNKLKEDVWKYNFESLRSGSSKSDMWSSWFRPLTIALIEDAYPELNKNNFKWNFRKKPGLGWHYGT